MAVFLGFTLSYKTKRESIPPLNKFGITGTDLDKLGQIARDQQKHEERSERELLEHDTKNYSDLLQEMKAQREQLQREQERKDAEEHEKRFGAEVYSLVCGIPAAIVTILVTFFGTTTWARAIPPEATNLAYATLGVMGGYWCG